MDIDKHVLAALREKADKNHLLRWMSRPSLIMVGGSRAYGTASEDSDWDTLCVAIPPLDDVFMNDVILGFDNIPKPSDAYHVSPLVEEPEIDTTIFSVVKWAKLLSGGSPNVWEPIMVDPLWSNCELDDIVALARSSPPLKLAHAFRSSGYAMKDKVPHHSYRCMLYAQRIATTGTFDLSLPPQYVEWKEMHRAGVFDHHDVLEQMNQDTKEMIDNSKTPMEMPSLRNLLMGVLRG